MRTFNEKFALLIILMTAFTFQTSFGQENENDESKFGLGVSLFNITEYSSYGYYNGYTNSIYMTFNLGSNYRLEPTAGFVLSDGLEQYSIGIGAFRKKSISKFSILYGLRLGLNSGEMINVAPAIGGEYYFIKNFSIGSEVQLMGLFTGGDWAVLTNSSVIVRFYF